jgi:hypothetical protein
MLINTINFLLRKKISIFPNIGIFWSSDEDQKNICYPFEIIDYSVEDYEEEGANWWYGSSRRKSCRNENW